MKTEQVLCISRDRLPTSWVEKRTVLPMDLGTFVDQCRRSGFSFINRDDAEQDPGRKQIIPYILLQTEDGSRTAVYNRKGSEQRLHDLWSLGIGGHINPVDSSGTAADFQTILLSGMERELNEELVRRPVTDRITFEGIISEDVTPVGSVHLGAVFRILTPAPEAYVPGSELYRFAWMSTGTLKELTLELWSELALELISPDPSHPGS